jgi:L-lactate dehydrogenase complex protein LldG
MTQTAPTPHTPAGLHDADIERISELVAPLGVTAERSPHLRAAARAISAFARDLETREVLVSGELLRAAPGLMNALDDAGIDWRVPADLNDSVDAALGVSLAAGVLVETGSVILTEGSLSDRGIGLVALHQIMFIPVNRIVAGLEEGAAIIREVARKGGYATFVTGPSRTADIEMSLTVGVQGPGRVHYLFVDSLR